MDSNDYGKVSPLHVCGPLLCGNYHQCCTCMHGPYPSHNVWVANICMLPAYYYSQIMYGMGEQLLYNFGTKVKLKIVRTKSLACTLLSEMHPWRQKI